jgi:alpha-methylacyl-CoA racemase
MTAAALPLEGIRVLDLSRLLPGPFATLVLADMGAAVDKLEDLDAGDYLRHMPPKHGDDSAMFLVLNRNKRSLGLDLKKPEGKAAFLRLLQGYDVLVDQFRPGVLARLGLSHDDLLAAHPRLVICALTGYGQTGPHARRAGHDLNYLARAGLLGAQGPHDGVPAVPGYQLADVGGALWAAVGILAALHERTRTQRGSVVDISMMDAAMGFGISNLGQLFGGQAQTRGAMALTGGIAPYRTYRTKDERFVALAALEPKFWIAFCAAVGLEADLGALMPGPHQAALMSAIENIFSQRTLAEWTAFAQQHDVCLEPVLEPHELEADAQVVARGLMFPLGGMTHLRLPTTPQRRQHSEPPKRGEHTDDILREAGFSDEERAALRASGAAR